ncbi:MAG: VOC family protein [Rhodospirillaceae bacterium]|nr:VOC family protein [Rhodospirillaceae bacterium]
MPHDHTHDHDHNHDHDHHHHHHETKLRLQSVRVYVGDFGAAFKFYAETVGLNVVTGDENSPFAIFDTGAAQLAVEYVAPTHPAYGELVGRFLGVSFVTKDLAALYMDLAGKGVEFMAPPQKQAWGGGIAHMRDTAGNILSIIGKLGP